MLTQPTDISSALEIAVRGTIRLTGYMDSLVSAVKEILGPEFYNQDNEDDPGEKNLLSFVQQQMREISEREHREIRRKVDVAVQVRIVSIIPVFFLTELYKYFICL